MKISALAAYLADNIAAIASHEEAGQCFSDVQNVIEDIERKINRPHDPKYCGPCPTVNPDQSSCGVALFAEWDEQAKQYNNDLVCWKCHATHSAEQLISDALGDVDGWLFTAEEILETMKQIGEPISDRTWRHWRKTGAIQSRNELGAEPKYYIGEVRYLRQQYAKIRAS